MSKSRSDRRDSWKAISRLHNKELAASKQQCITPLPFVKIAPKNLDLRCVLLPDPSTLGAGGKPCLEPSKKVNPPFFL